MVRLAQFNLKISFHFRTLRQTRRFTDNYNDDKLSLAVIYQIMFTKKNQAQLLHVSCKKDSHESALRAGYAAQLF